MNHEFKLKYDELKDNDPSQKEEDKNYFAPSSTRNVCFVQTDGKMLFLNYGYLISGEYLPNESLITLYFTSHTIILKGAKLESLYQDFFNHVPRLVICLDERYEEISENNTYTIHKIEVSINN